MADSPNTATAMTESDVGLASVLPIGLILPNNLLLAKALPFDAYELPHELQVSLERTKQRWGWFSKAKDHDKERGTQLGTLGYLPWEIRQKIFGNVFDGCRYVQIEHHMPYDHMPDHGEGYWDPWSREGRWRSWCNKKTLPYIWRGLAIRNASASLRLEVEHAFITMAHFEFWCDRGLNYLRPNDWLKYFLDHLTTYEKSLLRSVKIPLVGGRFIEPESRIRMADFARLPSGLTSIIFEFNYINLKIAPTKALKITDSLNLLGNKIRRCWSPRAKISIEYACWDCLPGCPKRAVASAFDDVEPWSEDWLDWWASSQDHDQAEEQSSLAKTRLMKVRWFRY